MNQYGAQALEHWRKYRPRELAEIENPTRYFTDLGEQIAGEIARRRNAQEQQTSAGQSTDFLANLGSLNVVQSTVTAEVMRELVFSTEEN